jgi:hypothetical protein
MQRVALRIRCTAPGGSGFALARSIRVRRLRDFGPRSTGGSLWRFLPLGDQSGSKAAVPAALWQSSPIPASFFSSSGLSSAPIKRYALHSDLT